MSNDQDPHDPSQDSDARLSFTVATVWRRERISCPHPHVLQSYLAGGLEGGAYEFVQFHLQDSACPYCNATIEDLQARDDEAKAPVLADVKDRLLRSTAVELQRHKPSS